MTPTPPPEPWDRPDHRGPLPPPPVPPVPPAPPIPQVPPVAPGSSPGSTRPTPGLPPPPAGPPPGWRGPVEGAPASAGSAGVPTGPAGSAPRRRRRRLPVLVAALVVVAGAGAAAWWVLRDEAPGPVEVEPVVGFVFGSVEDAGGNGVGAAEVEVTEAGSDRAVGTATTDELGLFEVDLGSHEGPVVVRATSGDQAAATVVAVRADGMVTGLRLVVGPAGPGSVSGQVVAAEGVTFDPGTGGGTGAGGAGLVEARFVETGRTEVVVIGPDGRYRLDGLPLDGDLIVVATTAAGTNQGLTATVVSESLTTNSADITLRAPSVATATDPGEQPEIVTEDLSDWVVDGSVTVVPADELG